MNNFFTVRLKAFLPSISMLCLLFLMTTVQSKAITTSFSTDTSWRVANTGFANWALPTYVMTPAWMVPGGGKTNCNQVGVSGANKIWYPSTNANQTNYFRKAFSIPNTCELKSVTVDIAADDNYILFINGVAIGTGGAIAKIFTVPSSILKCDNVIAVQARDFNGNCWWMSAKVTINTTPISISAFSNSSSANPICVGQTLNLFAGSLAGATYSWMGPGGFTSSLQNPVKPNVAMSDSGMYVVTINVGKCCRFVSRIQVGIKNCVECLDLISKEIYCKNGIYYMNVCFKNNSSHTANFINLISTTAGVAYAPNILSPPGGLLPGQTYCKTVIVSGMGATAGANVCLKATLLEIKNCQPTWSCTSMNDLCVKLPDCQIVPVLCNWKAAVKDSMLIICKGASTTLSAFTVPVVGGATYAWTSVPASVIVNGTTATPTVTPSSNPTTYTVTISVINPDGTVCKKTATVVVSLKDCPPPNPCDLIAYVRDTTIKLCRGKTVVLKASSNVSSSLYNWSPSTGVSGPTNLDSLIVSPSSTTIYTVTVSLPNNPNCVRTRTVKVEVVDCLNTTPSGQRKISEEEAIEDIQIAPNPTQSIISVQIPDSINWEKATLINAQGIILNEQERLDEAKFVKFDVQPHPSGIYIVRVKTDRGFINKKVIKE